jgi:uncharacterized membrane protein YqiK
MRNPGSMFAPAPRLSLRSKSEEQSHAQAKANAALAEAVKAEQGVETTRATAAADREKQIALISASREAEQKAISVKVAAEAEKEAAANRAAAIKIKADADRVAFEVEATGKRLINEAINVLSSDQIGMQVKLALIRCRRRCNASRLCGECRKTRPAQAAIIGRCRLKGSIRANKSSRGGVATRLLTIPSVSGSFTFARISPTFIP